MTLPAVPPDVAAGAVEALPARLRRRLDELVQTARGWPVTQTADGFQVTVDAETTVSLTRVVTSADDLRCTCLLAPRCLHRAAVASLAPTAEPPVSPSAPAAAEAAAQPSPATASAGPAATASAEAAEPPPAAGPAAELAEPAAAEVTADERVAATALWEAGVAVLATGIPGAGAVPQAALLRAAHRARALGLHRGAAAAVRVVEHLRAVHRDDPGFRLADLVADLRELLLVAHGLRTGRPLRGVARRAYELVGSRRLYGLCCEPVLTASGYAGVAVHLVDDAGRFWQVADVLPGGVELAVHKPDSPTSVGEVRRTYRELGRTGLIATDLHASADGRISTGQRVRAVAASGVSWAQPPLDALWTVPMVAQVARYHAALDLPATQRPAGYDLAFVTGWLGTPTPAGLVLLTGSVAVHAITPHDSPRLPYVDNLRLLAGLPGRRVRLVGRFAGPGTVEAIAIWVDGMDQHIDLGIDRLGRGHLPASGAGAPGGPGGPDGTAQPGGTAPLGGPTPLGGRAQPGETAQPAPPLHLLGRRVERAVEGGRPAVPGDPRDAERLRGQALPTAAELVERLEAACRAGRDAFGRLRDSELDPYARAWLDAAVYHLAVTRSVEAEHWQGPALVSSPG